MKRFWAFVKKEIYHILRDTRTLLIIFGMPVVMVLIFGYAITNEFNDASIAVLDNAHDALSQELIHKLESSGHFKIVAYLDHYEELEANFKKGAIKMAMVIPPNFEKDFSKNGGTQIQLIADGSEPNYATSLVGYATAIVQKFGASRDDAPGLRSSPKSPLASAKIGQLNIETRMVYNAELKSVYMFVPGLMAMILMLISAMMTSLTLAKEKELGTMELLLVSPLHPLMILFGKVTPYVILSFIDAILILVIGVYVFEVPIKGSLLLLLSSCALFVITSLALGIFISTKTATQQAAMMISLVALMMPTILLSGFMFPIESMPLLLQGISHILPAKYFIIVLKNVMLKGTAISIVSKELLILSGMATVFMLLSLKNFKTRIG